jgi:hypothetical protein
VGDIADRFGADVQFGTQQINEQSLRLLVSDLRANERGEAYLRFVDEADKNFLRYRTLRAWVRGRGPGWEEGDLQAYLKVGRDEHNFYLYRTGARTDTWEPELVVDLEQWLRLRAQIEAAWLRGDPPSGASGCGGDSTAYVICEGPYLVHIRDPGTSPPNLARVSEVAVGVFRTGESAVIPQAELWVDDLRLANVVDDMGLAGAFDARLTAADVADFSVSVTGRDAQFRQLGEEPGYVGTGVTSMSSSVQLGKFFPESWGLAMPVTWQHVGSREDPFYLNRRDVRADALSGLRQPRSGSTTYSLTLRRIRPGRSLLEHVLVDPVSINAAHQRADATTSLSEARTTNRQASIGYVNPPGARTVSLGILGKIADLLPGFIRNGDLGRSLRSARLRWNPAQVRLGSAVTDNRSDRSTFRVPVVIPGDTTGRAFPSVVKTWRNDAGVELRPFNTLTARMDYSRTNDFQDYGDSTTMGRLLETERETALGRDVGFERNRTLNTVISAIPVISSWFRPRITLSSTFGLIRDPNAREPVRVGADSAGQFIVPQTLSNSRRRELGATVDIGLLARRVAGDSSLVARLLRGVQSADVSEQREWRSAFDRAPFSPTLHYQLGLGGLDEFRARAGIPATAAATTRTRTAAGGLEIGRGLRTRFTYQDLQSTNWVRRGDSHVEIRQRTREWPSGTLSWIYTPQWGLRRVITNITTQARYRETSTQTVHLTTEGASQALSENRSTTVNPSVTLSWVKGIITAGQYTHTLSELVSAGNVTRTERDDWSGSLTFAFRVPRSVVRLPNLLRSTVRVTASDLLVCLVRAGADQCTTISDSRRRQADLRMDTGFSSSVSGGLSFSYVLTEQRHTATKLSQVIATVFAEINFQAGQVR